MFVLIAAVSGRFDPSSNSGSGTTVTPDPSIGPGSPPKPPELKPASVVEAPRPSDICFRDLGLKSFFGSTEQVDELKSLPKTKCAIVGFAFKLKYTTGLTRSTLLVADFDKKVMLRLTIDPVSRPWEQWSGFRREDVLADDPADGFDLKGYVASSGQPPSAPASLSTFIKANKMQAFLP